MPHVAPREQRSAPARILADARPTALPKEAKRGAAAWAPWAWRALDPTVLATHARHAAEDILPTVWYPTLPKPYRTLPYLTRAAMKRFAPGWRSIGRCSLPMRAVPWQTSC